MFSTFSYEISSFFTLTASFLSFLRIVVIRFGLIRLITFPESEMTGEKWMEKSVNIGDQLSQVIGIYYPYRIDNYVKYVRSQKFYGRYMDDWYIMNPSKEELLDLLDNIHRIAEEYGIHINKKKTRIVKISSTYKFLQIKYSLTDSGIFLYSSLLKVSDIHLAYSSSVM